MMKNEIIVDTILWIFIQNVINLPYEYLQETNEYSIFEECQSKDVIYKISKTELDDYNYIKNSSNINILDDYYIFTNFFEMLLQLHDIFISQNKTDTIKYNLLVKAIPIMQEISLMNKLESIQLK